MKEAVILFKEESVVPGYLGMFPDRDTDNDTITFNNLS